MSNQSSLVGISTIGPLAFTIGDTQTSAADLKLSAASSNAALVPASVIKFGGTSANRTVTVTPISGAVGSTVITLTVTDAGGLTATDKFTVTITGTPPSPNTPPTITDIANQTIEVGATNVGPIAFTVSDARTAAADLKLTGTSSDLNLIAISGITFSGTGANRSVTFTPVAGATGKATITVTVTDSGGLSATETFVLTINPKQQDQNLIGNPSIAVGSETDSNVRVFNPDGSVRASFTPFPGAPGGVRVASTDFTGDGIADVIAGTGPGGPSKVAILDGTSGGVVFTLEPFEAAFTGGVFVAVGDLTGDGQPEFIVTPDEGGGPRVRVYSSNGQELADFFGIDDPDFRGGARAAIGDLNGDNIGDLLVAAGFGGGPRVAGYEGGSVLAGQPSRLFADFFAFEETLRNGVYLTAGDLNADGFADVIAGGGPGGGPRVFALSGRDLLNGDQRDQLANFFGGDETNRGGIRVTVKDLDGDRFADLVVGAGPGGGSSVTGYRGIHIPADGQPEDIFAIDEFGGFAGGVYVG